MRLLAGLTVLAFATSAAQAEELAIFDAHIHYSHDAVEMIPPERVAEILREAGVSRALVSSSDDDGTQRLMQAAPEIVVPALRPYRRRGAINSWMHDPAVIDYLEARLAAFEYEAIGEFHAYGDDIRTDVIQRLIELARERDLLLHHHGDVEAVDLIFETWPEARVLWAHSGFESPQDISDALRRHERLWADLAFRSDMAGRDGLTDEWRNVFETFPDRFMVGTDTFAPERWYYVVEHADYSRRWLSELPPELARKIAHGNATAMLATRRSGSECRGRPMTIETGEIQRTPRLEFAVPPVSRPFEMALTFCGDGPAPEAVTVDATMPAHKHGMNYTPVIEALGDGRFRVSGLVLHMPGAWRIAVTAKTNSEEQRFILDIDVR